MGKQKNKPTSSSSVNSKNEDNSNSKFKKRSQVLI